MSKFTVTVCLMVVVGFSQSSFSLPTRWDGHPDGLIHYYEIVVADSWVSWAEARMRAEASSYDGLNGYFGSITSAAEQDFIVANLLDSPYSDTAVWLGGYQDPQGSAPASDWHWTSGEAWSYTNWDAPEPNNAPHTGGEEYLLEMYWNAARDDGIPPADDGKWNDMGIMGNRKGFLVEFATPSSNVPDASSTMLLLGYALAGLTALRKWKRC